MRAINRIKANEEFVVTVKQGKVLKKSPYIIHYIFNGLTYNRIGLSVSKKLGDAVTRNRVKRQVRAMCDSLIDYSSHTFDIVIVVKGEFLENSFDDNKNTLNELLSKIGTKDEKN